MIYITGDCHRRFDRFDSNIFPEQNDMNENDYVIICGDFGGIWNEDYEDVEESFILDQLNNKPFTTLFVDGNHENFDRLYEYPVKKWHGGKVHKIRPKVLHLCRGEIFDIDGASFFAFGGAKSHDIDDGVLDLEDPDFIEKRKELDRRWALYRINHISWWKEELPTEKEMDNGRKNLLKHNNEVDYIITHCCSSSTQAILGRGGYKTDILTDYFEDIKQNVKFKKWFFGHYHDNVNVSADEILIYEQIIRIK